MPLRRPMFMLTGLKAFGGPGTEKRNIGVSYLALLSILCWSILSSKLKDLKKTGNNRKDNNRII